jgi:hypothetical protein
MLFQIDFLYYHLFKFIYINIYIYIYLSPLYYYHMVYITYHIYELRNPDEESLLNQILMDHQNFPNTITRIYRVNSIRYNLFIIDIITNNLQITIFKLILIVTKINHLNQYILPQ